MSKLQSLLNQAGRAPSPSTSPPSSAGPSPVKSNKSKDPWSVESMTPMTAAQKAKFGAKDSWKVQSMRPMTSAEKARLNKSAPAANTMESDWVPVSVDGRPIERFDEPVTIKIAGSDQTVKFPAGMSPDEILKALHNPTAPWNKGQHQQGGHGGSGSMNAADGVDFSGMTPEQVVAKLKDMNAPWNQGRNSISAKEDAKRGGYFAARFPSPFEGKSTAIPANTTPSSPVTREAVGNDLRPAIETGGAILGGLLGAPEGGVMAVPGAALGYSIASRIADLLMGKKQSVVQATEQSLKDLGTGASMEMGGQAAGSVLSRLLGPLARNVFTKSGQETRAGQVLDRLLGKPTAQDAANLAKSEDLQNRMGVKLTPAQQTGAHDVARFEQGLATRNPKFAKALSDREAGATQTALNRFLGTLGKGESLPTTQGADVTGQAIREGLESELSKVKGAEKDLWGQVPDFEMPTNHVSSAIRELSQEPLDRETQRALDNAVEFLGRVPKTVKGLDAVSRTLTSDISAAYRSGNAKLARPLSILKDAIGKDFDELGNAAGRGDIALHGGNLIYPRRIGAELQDLESKIQSGGALPEHLDRHAALQDQLANMQPAPDVAQAIHRAKQFSRLQHFDRFSRGAVKQVLANGDQFGGGRLPFEKIPARFFNPSGWRDLVRGLGGKQAAADYLKPGIMDDFLSRSVDTNGNFNIQKGLSYLQKHHQVLDESGILPELKSVVRGQLPGEFRRLLETKRMGRENELPYFTVSEATGLLKKYGPTVRELYGKDALGSLRDYRDLMFSLGRNRNVARGGSVTAEKLLSGDELTPKGEKVKRALMNAFNLAGGAVGWHAGGWGGGATGYMTARFGTDLLRQVMQESSTKVDQLLSDALLNPAEASRLMQIAKAATDPERQKLAAEFVRQMVWGASGATAPTGHALGLTGNDWQ